MTYNQKVAAKIDEFLKTSANTTKDKMLKRKEKVQIKGTRRKVISRSEEKVGETRRR